jgi:hypothetical protein
MIHIQTPMKKLSKTSQGGNNQIQELIIREHNKKYPRKTVKRDRGRPITPGTNGPFLRKGELYLIVCLF